MKFKKVFPLIAMSIIILMGSCKKDETSTLSPLSPGISSADTNLGPKNICTIKKWRLGESNP